MGELPVLEPGARQLAILAFTTASGDQSRHDLAAAIGARVSQRLGTVRPREVIARDSRSGGVVGALNGRSGAEARYLLAAELEPDRPGVSFLVRLLDGATGREVWRGRFARGRDRLYELEGAISSAVGARTLRDLSSEEARALAAPPTRNASAYDNLLAGLQLLDKRERAALPRAIEALDRAWRADPQLTEAWVQLSLAYGGLLARNRLDAPDAEAVRAAALEAADRALALDARRSDAWVARGIVLEHRNPRSLAGVRDAYERALAVDPNNYEAHRRLGNLLRQVGELDRAAVHLRSALFLEPERAHVLTDIAELHLAQGRYGDACAVLNAALDADPGAIDAYILRVLARIPLHEYRAAWADAETAMRLGSPTQGEAVSLLVDLAAEDTVAARARLRRLRERPLTQSDGPLSVREGQLLALAFATAGERAIALRSLERVRPRGAALWRVMQDQRLAPLRADRRYQTLLASASPFEDQP
jgi:tetratricopeptide (TPR) repeat protein